MNLEFAQLAKNKGKEGRPKLHPLPAVDFSGGGVAWRRPEGCFGNAGIVGLGHSIFVWLDALRNLQAPYQSHLSFFFLDFAKLRTFCWENANDSGVFGCMATKCEMMPDYDFREQHQLNLLLLLSLARRNTTQTWLHCVQNSSMLSRTV